MVFDFDPGVLLGRFYPLADGSRVGLRVARPSDAAAIRDLVASHGEASHGAAELDIRRLVNCDPRHCCVICATALVDQGERMIGVGSIELGEGTGGGQEPELVLVAPEAPSDVAALLTGALVSRAGALAQARAA